MLNASEALQMERFTLPGRKVITKEITHKLVLIMFIMQNRVKRLWAEGKEESLCRRNRKKNGNKGMMYSEVASTSLRVL